MNAKLMMVSLLIVSSGLAAGGPAAAGSGCGGVLESDTSALWAHGEVPGPAGLGSVDQGNPHGWANFGTALHIWKTAPDGKGDHPPTLTPVTFVQPFLVVDLNCAAEFPTLQIAADNSFIAYLNEVPVAACGAGPAPGAEILTTGNCYGSDQALPITPSLILAGANEIRVEAWNTIVSPSTGGLAVIEPSPAMVTYRLVY